MTKQNLNQLIQLVHLIQLACKQTTLSHYKRHGKNLGLFFTSTEFELQAMVITLPNGCKETGSSQIAVSHLWQDRKPQFGKINPFSEFKRSFDGSETSLNDEIKNQEASASDPSTVHIDSKTPQKKKTCEPDSSRPP